PKDAGELGVSILINIEISPLLFTPLSRRSSAVSRRRPAEYERVSSGPSPHFTRMDCPVCGVTNGVKQSLRTPLPAWLDNLIVSVATPPSVHRPFRSNTLNPVRRIIRPASGEASEIEVPEIEVPMTKGTRSVASRGDWIGNSL